MNRFLLALAALLAPAPTAAGQSPYWEMAPLRFLADVDAATGHDAVAMSLGVDRSVPLDFFLPNVGPGSRIDVMGLGAGVRIVDGSAAFRWRIAPLVIDLTRPPWNGGVTLLRQDRTGLRTVEADWLAVHGGPSARVVLGTLAIEPSIVLRGAVASRRTGRSFFPDLPRLADEGATGLAGSAAARILVSRPGGLSFMATASAERLWAGADPEMRTLQGALRVPLTPAWSVIGRAAWNEARIVGARDRTTTFGLSIRFSPRAAGSV
jgi:hypothetical protein